MPGFRRNNKNRRRPYRRGGQNKKVMKYRRKANSHYVPSKVPLLQPITLKPFKLVRRVVYNNLIKVDNVLLSSGGTNTVNPQFIKLNLNSPWLLSDDTYSAGGGSSWAPNRVMSAHTDGNSGASGTSYPGLFETDQSIGNCYRQFCVAGCKFTATYTPVMSDNGDETQPTALFCIAGTGPSGLTSSNISSNTVYDMPFSRVSKIMGVAQSGSGAVSKLSKGGFVSYNYSAKRANFVKDLQDTKGLWASNQSDSAKHPSEKDTILVGLVPLMDNDTTKPLVSGILQIRMEAFMLFGEPNNQQNLADPVVQE